MVEHGDDAMGGRVDLPDLVRVEPAPQTLLDRWYAGPRAGDRNQPAVGTQSATSTP